MGSLAVRGRQVCKLQVCDVFLVHQGVSWCQRGQECSRGILGEDGMCVTGSLSGEKRLLRGMSAPGGSKRGRGRVGEAAIQGH